MHNKASFFFCFLYFSGLFFSPTQIRLLFSGCICRLKGVKYNNNNKYLLCSLGQLHTYIYSYIHIVSHRVFVCSLSICDWCAQRACWKMRVAVICICKIQICQIRVVPQETAGALNMHCGTSIARHRQTAIDSEIYRLSHWSNAK